MKNYFLLLVAVLLTAKSIKTFPFDGHFPDCSQCKNGLLLADKTSCANYYVCYGGQAIKKQCPPGFLFDNNAHVCAMAFMVNCNFPGIGLNGYTGANPLFNNYMHNYYAGLFNYGMYGYHGPYESYNSWTTPCPQTTTPCKSDLISTTCATITTTSKPCNPTTFNPPTPCHLESSTQDTHIEETTTVIIETNGTTESTETDTYTEIESSTSENISTPTTPKIDFEITTPEVTTKPSSPETETQPITPDIVSKPTPPETDIVQSTTPEIIITSTPPKTNSDITTPEVTTKPSSPETETQPITPDIVTKPTPPETDIVQSTTPEIIITSTTPEVTTKSSSPETETQPITPDIVTKPTPPDIQPTTPEIITKTTIPDTYTEITTTECVTETSPPSTEIETTTAECQTSPTTISCETTVTTISSTESCTSTTTCSPPPCKTKNISEIKLDTTPYKYMARSSDCLTLENDTILLDAQHCRRYYMCQHGRLRRLRCSLGQWYDRELGMCRKREDVLNCPINRN